MAPKPNIIWIVADALRADRCGCYGYDRPTTPNLDQLAREGLRGEITISQGGYSHVSYPTMLTGLYPTEHGVFGGKNRLARDIPVLPEILSMAGYRTGCIGGNPFLTEHFGLTRGFDFWKSWDRVNVAAPGDKGWQAAVPVWQWPQLMASSFLSALGLRDKGGAVLNNDVKQFAASGEKDRWFVFLHYMETHSPYWPPLKHRLTYHTRWMDAVRSPFLARHMIDDGIASAGGDLSIRLRNDQYDAEVAYTDKLIGDLLSDLEADGHLANTIVIVCSDHGEYLGERGLFRHAVGLGEILIRVPLIVWAPDYIERRVIENTVVELRDIPHSLCNLIDADGLAEPARDTLDLFADHPLEEGRPGFAEWREARMEHRSANAEYRELLEASDRTARLLRYPEWEYIEYADGERRLHDVESDPAGYTNVADEEQNLAARFSDDLTEIKNNLVPVSSGWSEEDMPAELEARLRGFGYM